jgi:hypothetical protein
MRIRAVAAMLVVGLTGEAFSQAAPKIVVGDNPSLSGERRGIVERLYLLA